MRAERATATASAAREQTGHGGDALILALIAVVVIVILTTLGHRVNNVFSNISHGLSRQAIHEPRRLTGCSLLAACYFDEDIQAVMDLGGITHMGKPFEFAHLLKMLWSSVGLEQPGNAAAARVISGASQG